MGIFSNQIDDTSESTVDYSQPGTLAGATAKWQANDTKEEFPPFTESFSTDYSAPTFEAAPAKETNGNIALAIISMVLGILSILCCCFWPISGMFALASLVLGIISLSKKCSGKGMAIAGITCSSVALVYVIWRLIATLGIVAISFTPSSYLDFLDGPDVMLDEIPIPDDDYYYY